MLDEISPLADFWHAGHSLESDTQDQPLLAAASLARHELQLQQQLEQQAASASVSPNKDESSLFGSNNQEYEGSHHGQDLDQHAPETMTEVAGAQSTSHQAYHMPSSQERPQADFSPTNGGFTSSDHPLQQLLSPTRSHHHYSHQEAMKEVMNESDSNHATSQSEMHAEEAHHEHLMEARPQSLEPEFHSPREAEEDGPEATQDEGGATEAVATSDGTEDEVSQPASLSEHVVEEVTHEEIEYADPMEPSAVAVDVLDEVVNETLNEIIDGAVNEVANEDVAVDHSDMESSPNSSIHATGQRPDISQSIEIIADTPVKSKSPEARRRRRSGAEMLVAASRSIIQTNAEARRRRRSVSVAATKSFLGRPKKGSMSHIKVNAQIAPKRGRPRNSAKPSSKLSRARANEMSGGVDGLASVPKKRGRPAKLQPLKVAENTETPRRRGRPSKNMSLETPLAITSSVLKRKPGRPSLGATPIKPGKLVQTVSSTPRRRGRPAKVVAEPSPQQNTTPQSQPRKRGRPSLKSSGLESPKPAEIDAEPPSTAKRGRPPKAVSAALGNISTPASSKRSEKQQGSTLDQATPNTKEINAEKPSTAKRGRPPKAVAAAAVEEVSSLPQKKRGRPALDVSKATDEPDSKRQRTEDTVDTPVASKVLEDVVSATKGSGRRGRPKSSTVSEEVPAKSHQEDPSPAPRRAGRPPAAKEESKPVAEVLPSPRPRGRPSKSATTDTVAAPEPENLSRPRGRPPQQTKLTFAKGSKPTGVVKSRGRGRPAKHRPVTS